MTVEFLIQRLRLCRNTQKRSLRYAWKSISGVDTSSTIELTELNLFEFDKNGTVSTQVLTSNNEEIDIAAVLTVDTVATS